MNMEIMWVYLFEKENNFNNSQFHANIPVLIRNTITGKAAVQGGKGLLEWNEFAVVIRILSCHVVRNESF